MLPWILYVKFLMLKFFFQVVSLISSKGTNSRGAYFKIANCSFEQLLKQVRFTGQQYVHVNL